jgi:hypothetical protein
MTAGAVRAYPRTMSDPPIDRWSQQEALREIVQIARCLPAADAERRVAARLARLTPEQRRIVREGLRGWEAAADAEL